MQTKSWSRSPLLVTSTLVLLSLIATFILFFYLESYAEVKNKKIQLGGAAACFVITLILTRITYTKISGSNVQEENEALERQVNSLQQQLDQAKAKEFKDLTIPEGYVLEASQDLGFAVCYPRLWTFIRHPANIQYGIISDPKYSKEHGFNRNINISLEAFNSSKLDFESSAKVTGEMILKVVTDGKLISSEPFLSHGNPAYRYIITYVLDDHDVKMFQALILTPLKDKILTVTYTTLIEDFDSSKGLFENVLGTIRFSE